MANNYQLMIMSLDNPTQEEKVWFQAIRPLVGTLIEILDESEDKILIDKLKAVSLSQSENPLGIKCDVKLGVWFYTDEYGDLDAVAEKLRCFLAKFRPTKALSFQWANTCSKHHPDEFGGGACVVTATEVYFMSTFSWVNNKLKELGHGQ